MNYKCPSCATALYFNPKTQLLECSSCGNMYRPGDFADAPGLSYSEKHDVPDYGNSQPQQQYYQQQQYAQQPQMQQQYSQQPQMQSPTQTMHTGYAQQMSPQQYLQQQQMQKEQYTQQHQMYQEQYEQQYQMSKEQYAQPQMQQPQMQQPQYTQMGYAPQQQMQQQAYGQQPQQQQSYEQQPQQQQTEGYSQNESGREQMECKIYHCNSCGAELVVNGEEAATFCAYCGQPAIVFQRISSEIKPDYIIPFSITKEQAHRTIKEKFAQGSFIPPDLRNVKIEKVLGVYVPFWLYNIHYYDNQFLRGTVGSGKSSHTEYFIREATCDFWNLTQDASLNLLDESSTRLEPYDMRGLVPFDAAYLSGFYADKYERGARDFENDARVRAIKMFNDTVKKSINASSIKIMYNRPLCQFQSASYAMLPVWFFTYRYEFQIYTILINGQTGKMIGAAPIDKKRVVSRFALIFAALALVLCCLFPLMLGAADGDDVGDFVIMALVVAGICFATGAAKFKAIKNNLKYAKSASTLDYATNRQEV